jgi:Uma2 family endonuclease
VREYWVVDPELETVKVHRQTEHGFSRVAELSAERGDAPTTPLLPDFSVKLGEIFALAI